MFPANLRRIFMIFFTLLKRIVGDPLTTTKKFYLSNLSKLIMFFELRTKKKPKKIKNYYWFFKILKTFF